MVTKEQIKDWLEVGKKNQLEEEIEEYIDEKIKGSALRGQRTIYISTGYPDNNARRAVTNVFFELWCSNKISRDNLLYVRKNIIEKYRQIGLKVEEKNFDEGWNSSFAGLKITIPSDL